MVMEYSRHESSELPRIQTILPTKPELAMNTTLGDIQLSSFIQTYTSVTSRPVGMHTTTVSPQHSVTSDYASDYSMDSSPNASESERNEDYMSDEEEESDSEDDQKDTTMPSPSSSGHKLRLKQWLLMKIKARDVRGLVQNKTL